MPQGDRVFIRRAYRVGQLRRWPSCLALTWAAALPAVFGQGAGGARVMEWIPARFPLSIVIVNPQQLDASITSFSNRIDPDLVPQPLLAQLKRQLPVLEWVDLSQPLGVAFASLGSGSQPIFYVRVPDFSAKIKTLEEATEEAGVWRLTFGEFGVMYARVIDDYVIASSFNEHLSPADSRTSLAGAMKRHADVWRNRDALVHLNFEAIRSSITDQLTQLAAMAPMVAMLAVPQSADPTALINTMNAGADAIKQFVAQLGHVDLTLSVTENSVSATLLTGFGEGPIRNYLTGRQPADRKPFGGLREQPYIFATDFDFPGDQSPFMDFLLDKLDAGAPAPAGKPPGAAGEPPGSAASDETASRQDMKAKRELIRKVRGANMLLAATEDGIRFAANYFGSDPKSILSPLTQALLSPNATYNKLKAATGFESLGERMVGDVSISEHAMVPDTSNAIGAKLASVFGERARLAVGITPLGVGACLGDEAYVTQHFAGTPDKPFAAGRHVAKALGKLPPKHNIVVLFDLASSLTLGGPLLGLPGMDPVPPGPPIAISLSLSSNPARVDIHVPARALARYFQMLRPDEPM